MARGKGKFKLSISKKAKNVISREISRIKSYIEQKLRSLSFFVTLDTIQLPEFYWVFLV